MDTMTDPHASGAMIDPRAGGAMIDPRAGGATEDAIDRLLAPHVDALFWRPVRLGVDSAWYGHLPFAHWIVAASRPRLLVELGTHAGVSYSAFCESVRRSGLDTRCLAVDTWQGDEHAGFYGEEIFNDLSTFHDARYAGFSTLLRCTFDAALGYVADGSIDLLHIDGRHAYEDVRQDFDSWRPKLSARAVVLLHDTNERPRGFGVWRLWAELAAAHPHFEFLHEHGLGVLCVGPQAPEAVQELCRPREAAEIAALRERFALLGERWSVEHQHRNTRCALVQDRARIQAHADALEAKFGELISYTTALERNIGQPPARAELRNALARAVAADHERLIALDRAAAADAQAAAAHAKTAAAQAETLAMRREMEAIAASRSWRVAQRLRAATELLRGSMRHPLGAMGRTVTVAPGSPAPAAPAPVAAIVGPPRTRQPAILFAAGEPDTPGCAYRCVRLAASAAAAGWQARWKPVAEVSADDLRDTDLVILWRVTWSPHVEGLIEHVRGFGGRVALDLDDLMIRPELARVEFIDAIRSINWSEAHVRAMFTSIVHVLHNVDLCIATTEELAREMRRFQKAAYVLANGFDAATFRRARMAARARLAAPPDALVRIGYAGGSRTHQRDFAAAAEALAAVLAARPQTRLVLFRHGEAQEGLVAPEEFPALAAHADRIEWRELAPLDALPDELARFDINIVPLQTGNPFVEAKSELKFFEAAIAGVPSVASPTGPYARAIRDGETGFLAADAPAWQQALLALVDDPALRQRIARNACGDVLWRFGPEGQAETMRRFLAQQHGGAQPADCRTLAAAFALDLAVAPRRDFQRLPPGDATETLFMQDRLAEAAVTVVITAYNYADHIQEALESVRLQTLAPLDLVVVDDCSTDLDMPQLILDWAHANAGRFNRLVVLRHLGNAGPGAARNTGFAWAETPYVLPLDADNRLRPGCAEQLFAALDGSGAAFAYPRLQHFGGDAQVSGGARYEPQRLIGGNYIDAMALIARWAWSAAGGYYPQRDVMGWEDFSLWCRMAELGFWGQAVDAVLAEYRVHHGSMVDTFIETDGNKLAIVDFVEQRHPWLDILARDPHARTR